LDIAFLVQAPPVQVPLHLSPNSPLLWLDKGSFVKLSYSVLILDGDFINGE
jgi:hypothetical protein